MKPMSVISPLPPKGNSFRIDLISQAPHKIAERGQRLLSNPALKEAEVPLWVETRAWV